MGKDIASELRIQLFLRINFQNGETIRISHAFFKLWSYTTFHLSKNLRKIICACFHLLPLVIILSHEAEKENYLVDSNLWLNQQYFYTEHSLLMLNALQV